MKKLSVLAITLLVAFSFASCGTTSGDLKTMAKDTAVKEGSAKAEKEAAKASCKKDCDKVNDDCVKKAGKNAKKAKACETAKTKCYADCDKK